MNDGTVQGARCASSLCVSFKAIPTAPCETQGEGSFLWAVDLRMRRKDEWPVQLTVSQTGHGDIDMSEIVDKGKEVGEKAKNLADVGIEKLKGVDWKAQGDKAKALADAGLDSLKKVDWKAQGETAKAKAIDAKNKIISTWESGRKGKVIVITGGILCALVLKSCFFGGSSPAYCFSEDDFEKECDTDQMFYVKSGKDDGLKDVVPNLKKMPSMLKADTSLCSAFNPGLEEECHHKGWAYYNDPEYPTGYYCQVIHVGDGWVVVKPNSLSMFGNYLGYIETDDSYIEGQNLNAGFYVFVGTQKVPLANGSSKTMHAFVKIDSKSNEIAVEAVRYNLNALVAADEENKKRCTKREYCSELPAAMEAIKNFSACTVHAPSSVHDCAKDFHFEYEAIQNVGRVEKANLNDLVKHAKKKDTEYFLKFCDEAVCRPNFLLQELSKAKVPFSVKGFDTKKIKDKYKVAGYIKNDQFLWKLEVQSGTTQLTTEFFVYESDEEFEEALVSGYAKDFVKHWNEKYSK